MNTSLQTVRNTLHAAFPERKPVIDGALCAVLASEHVLLLGPPGTAKSALVRALAQSFGGTYFERLLTRFSTPEELFGPISLKALEQDQFVRLTHDKLPEADFAFVDEVFKANSAILNSLLTLLNERLFHNSGAPVRCPLVSLFGASNELPEGPELEALFDRFILRFEVGYLLRPGNLRAVLTSPEPKPPPALDLATLRQLQAELNAIRVTDETIDALIAIREQCKQEGIVASDRRWKKSLNLAKAAAYLTGATETTPEDLTFLVDSLWREPKERPKVARLVGTLADPVSTKAAEVLDAARETAAKLSAPGATERQDFIAQATQALQTIRSQQDKLKELARTASQRATQAVQDALIEVNQLHAELARTVSQGLGLGHNLRVAK